MRIKLAPQQVFVEQMEGDNAYNIHISASDSEDKLTKYCVLMIFRYQLKPALRSGQLG